MDGNRRFAKQANLPLKEGHNMGAESLLQVLECCFRIGVKNVTVYAFSIENFNRSKAEIDTIFDLLKSKLAYISQDNEFCELQKLRIKIIGDRSLVPPEVLADIEKAEERTKQFTDHTLYVAFPYTSRDDIMHSVQQIASKVKSGELSKEEIDEEQIEKNFYYEGEAGKVDILVRTSGHTRLSDYMIWQCHRDSVIEFNNTMWPDYKFYSTWWTLFKWSYFKTLLIEDAEKMQTNKLSKEQINDHYKRNLAAFNHPPTVSVTERA